MDTQLSKRIHQLSFFYMNTPISCTLFCETHQLIMVRSFIDRYFKHIEKTFSRFESDSELSKINRTQGKRMKVSDEMMEVLLLSLHYQEVTKGYFNIAIGHALIQVGYRESFEKLEEMNLVHVEETTKEIKTEFPIRLYPENMQAELEPLSQIDLGGIVKGWSVQKLANLLQYQWHIPKGIVNAGGDIALWGGATPDKPWVVGIENPWDPNKDTGYLWIFDGAVATSSKLGRSWMTGQGQMHHLIDPRSMKPSRSEVVQVTVNGEKVHVAEIWAKVICILDVKEAYQLILEKTPKIEVLIFTETGECTFVGDPQNLSKYWGLITNHVLEYIPTNKTYL